MAVLVGPWPLVGTSCYAALGEDPWLKPLLHRYAGLRIARAASLYEAKARYLPEVAERAAGGALEPARFAGLPDREAISRLCEIPGIGRWTAHEPANRARLPLRWRRQR